jgi:hypothetical protein
MLPDCQDGQLIGVNPDKSLTCVSALSGMLAPPTCTAGQVLTSMKNTVSGQNELSCVNTGNGLNDVATQTRITKATTDITDLQMKVTQITTGGGIRSRYAGPSTKAYMGNLLDANYAGKGPRQGNLICAAQYGVNAHICTPFEMYESVVIGDVLDGTTDVGPLMVYMESWIPTFGGAGSEPNAGLADNCGGFTYETAHAEWRNTFFSFAIPTGGTVRVPRFTANIPCGTSASLACCK